MRKASWFTGINLRINVPWNRKAVEPLFPCDYRWTMTLSQRDALDPFGCFLAFFFRSLARHHFTLLKIHNGACGQKYPTTWWAWFLNGGWFGIGEEADGFEVWIGGGEATGAHDRVTMEETIKRVSRINRIKPGRQFSFLHFYCLGRQLLLSSFLCISVHG